MTKFLTELAFVLALAISVSGCVLPQQTINLKVGDAKSIQILTQKTAIELESVDIANQIAYFSVYNPDEENTSRYNFSIKLGDTKDIMNTNNEYISISLDNIQNESVMIYINQGKPIGGGVP
jgi:hypothetical protein